LIRYWQNHPAQFTAPEYRTVKLVILSPALLAPRESVSAAEITAAYARATAGQSATPQRSLQVVTVADKKQAQKIAAAWRANAAWTNIQQRTTSTKGTAVELDNAQAAQIPDATLSAAAFAAPVGAVTGPVQGPFGWLVLKVLNAGTSLPSLASMQDQLTRQLQLQKAQAEVAQDVDNLQDALAGNTPLDQLPGNLGLIAVEGTLDAGGNAQDGTPAPIPGGADLKAAIVKAVFAAQLHDPAQLTNGPNGSYFAFTLDTITPPALKPYDQVKDQVLAAWTGDAVSREAQVQAAALYHAASTGQSLDDAASAAGLGVAMSAPITRNAPPAGILGQMVPILFSLKLNEATMAPAPGGFIVASLAKIIQPSANDDPADFQQVQASMAKAMQDDVAGSFITGLQSRDKVTINQKLFAQIYQ